MVLTSVLINPSFKNKTTTGFVVPLLCRKDCTVISEAFVFGPCASGGLLENLPWEEKMSEIAIPKKKKIGRMHVFAASRGCIYF